jgi:RNA 2',3'-cyclic 3'-phosphodiesterase
LNAAIINPNKSNPSPNSYDLWHSTISRMRLFIAVPLPPAVVQQLAVVTKRLRSDKDGLRWSSPESWHITLQFLGNTSDDQYACLVGKLRAFQSPRVPIKLEDLGFFHRAGVFFAGVSVTRELLLLQQHVTSATAQCGFVAENRPFHPHITLARAKGDARGANLRELKARIHSQPEFFSFVAQEFLLYEAFLGSAGSRYEIRERFPLGDRAPSSAS